MTCLVEPCLNDLTQVIYVIYRLKAILFPENNLNPVYFVLPTREKRPRPELIATAVWFGEKL